MFVKQLFFLGFKRVSPFIYSTMQSKHESNLKLLYRENLILNVSDVLSVTIPNHRTLNGIRRVVFKPMLMTNPDLQAMDYHVTSSMVNYETCGIVSAQTSSACTYSDEFRFGYPNGLDISSEQTFKIMQVNGLQAHKPETSYLSISIEYYI